MSAPTPAGLPRTVLRLHRPALIVWSAFVAALAGWLIWLNTVTSRAGERERLYCDHHETCNIIDWLDYGRRTALVAALVCYSFLGVAAWAGASLIGRELESGTAKLAWTQGVSPARWLAAKLAVPALLLTLGSTALVLIYRRGWNAHPALRDGDWTSAATFVARGPAAVAYALCALAVGTLAAFLLRRALPALGVSVAAMGALVFLMERLRPHLWPSVTRVTATEGLLTPHAWQTGAGTIRDGHRVPYHGLSPCEGNPAQVGRCADRLGIDGYYLTYHPQSHYWPLHLVETGIVLAVAALAAVLAFRRLPRRGRAVGKGSPA
ncbi:ABC transporter permease [Streptomyces sp. MBT33]|uniref:ABC transporter permease n=1 Tax=Streptomyces sp. MBT33 TaxID=1488363 RepID=UPI00190E2CDB|nr:ABC transporter permease [Streptomyces sp. MBT33]MBK3646946.1 ABC transporter permease [Streptomyces sp. MBT33]